MGSLTLPPWIPHRTARPVTPLQPVTGDAPVIPNAPPSPSRIPTHLTEVQEYQAHFGPPTLPEQKPAALTIQHIPDLPEPKVPRFETPTGVWTGQGIRDAAFEAKYKAEFSSGKHTSNHHEHLLSDAIGLKVDVDQVGTGKDRGWTKHATEMVIGDPFHAGQWHHEGPGNTVIAAHVSFKGNPGPFAELRNLGMHGHGAKDTVTLESADGKRTTYAYSDRTILKDPHDQKTWDKVFAPGDPEHKQLHLVTCCGPLDSHGLYKWRLIVELNEVKPHDANALAPGAKHFDLTHKDATTPLSTPRPVDATTPLTNSKPIDATTPLTNSKPIDATTPLTNSKPIDATTPLTTSKPIDATTPLTNSKPIDATSPLSTSTPVDATTPHQSANSIDVITTAANGVTPQTRIIYDSRRAHGNLSGISAELGADQNGLSYAAVGPNFTFQHDRTIATANLRLGLGTGHLIQSADLPIRGTSGVSLSSQFVVAQQLTDNTRVYAGGALGFQPGNHIGYQGFLETGVTHNFRKLGVGAAYQESKVDGFSPTSYAVLRASYHLTKSTDLELTAGKRLSHQSGDSSGSSTLFFGASHRF